MRPAATRRARCLLQVADALVRADRARRERAGGAGEGERLLDGPPRERRVEQPGRERVARTGAVDGIHVRRSDPAGEARRVRVTAVRARGERDRPDAPLAEPRRRPGGILLAAIACASARLGQARSTYGSNGSIRCQRPVGSHVVSRLVTRPRCRASARIAASGSPSSSSSTSAPPTCRQRPA